MRNDRPAAGQRPAALAMDRTQAAFAFQAECGGQDRFRFETRGTMPNHAPDAAEANQIHPFARAIVARMCSALIALRSASFSGRLYK
jgi:hypothetical protein